MARGTIRGRGKGPAEANGRVQKKSQNLGNTFGTRRAKKDWSIFLKERKSSQG